MNDQVVLLYSETIQANHGDTTGGTHVFDVPFYSKYPLIILNSPLEKINS